MRRERDVDRRVKGTQGIVDAKDADHAGDASVASENVGDAPVEKRGAAGLQGRDLRDEG